MLYSSLLLLKKGGVASGFNDITTNDPETKRLLHVKGRRVIHASEVPMEWSSFNRGDCFIIQLKEVRQKTHWIPNESLTEIVEASGVTMFHHNSHFPLLLSVKC